MWGLRLSAHHRLMADTERHSASPRGITGTRARAGEGAPGYAPPPIWGIGRAGNSLVYSEQFRPDAPLEVRLGRTIVML